VKDEPPSAGTDSLLPDDDDTHWRAAKQLRREKPGWLVIWVARVGRFHAYRLTGPLLGDILHEAPARLQQQLYQAFDLQLLYNKNLHQVTIWATITDPTPPALTAIINDAYRAHQPRRSQPRFF